MRTRFVHFPSFVILLIASSRPTAGTEHHNLATKM